jgi:hypothetical protein
MTELHMTDASILRTSKTEEEKELIQEIWRLLGGVSFEDKIVLKSARNFLWLVLNINKKFLYFPEIDSIDEKHFDKNTVGIISRDGVFYLRHKKEISKIHKSFKIFSINRFNYLNISKSTRYSSVPTKQRHRASNFTPKITKKSKNIDRKRNQFSKTPRHNILLKEGERYNEKLTEKHKIKENSEMKNWTFKPNLK